MWYRSSGRKPYYRLGESLIRFFIEPIRFIKESITIESEFEKPYYDDQYNWMHLKWNVPDWEWEWDTFMGGRNKGRRCWSISTPFCQIWCHVQDDTHSICQLVGGYSNRAFGITGRCFGPHYSCETFPEGTDLGSRLPGRLPVPSLYITHPSSDSCEEDFEIGAYFSWFEPKCSRVQHKDCSTTMKIFCDNPCQSGSYVAPTWSDTNPTSIIRRNPIEDSYLEITVDDGIGPYDWALSGSGSDFELAEATTEGNANYIGAGPSACGAVTITVTDSCGNECSGVILCTIGSWCVVDQCPTTYQCYSASCNQEDEEIGDYQYRACFAYVNPGASPPNDDCDNVWGTQLGYGCDCSPLTPPPTGDNPIFSEYCGCISNRTRKYECSC